MIKILNLYAGIGGNRKLWDNNKIEVTAIENNEETAAIYQDLYPKDKVLVCDAHQYLLEHYKEYDFIWSSRPCQSHSRARFWASKGGRYNPQYPDMQLYEEILFLKYYFNGLWVVENVIPFYEPFLNPLVLDRHLFWANFEIGDYNKEDFQKDNVKQMQINYGIDISKYKLSTRKDQILRNCVNPKLGLHIFNCAFKEKQEVLTL